MFRKPVRAVSRVFLHCSASDRPEHSNIETIRRWHIARGFADVGYHYFIGFDGVIEPGRTLERLPAAQRGHNAGSIAICLAGGQGGREDAFTNQQFQSLKRLCRAINEAFDAKVTFHGHSEVADKACPVYDYVLVLGLSPTGHMKEPRVDLAKSRTLKGGRIASAGAGLSAIEAALPRPTTPHEQSFVPPPMLDQPIRLDEQAFAPPGVPTAVSQPLSELLIQLGAWTLDVLPWLAIALVLMGVGLVLFARLDDFERGLR